MNRNQLDTILNELGAMQATPGFFTLAAGRTMTLHLGWGGTSFSIEKVRAVRVDGELLFADSGGQTIAALIAHLGVVVRE